MQYISEEVKRILADRLKIGESKKPTVRVEVDKYIYSPNMYSEVDIIRYVTDGTAPVIKSGVQSSNISAAATMTSPIYGKLFSQLTISSNFGMRKLSQETTARMHNGIDISNVDYVVAVADGEVIVAKENGTAGYNVDILHTSGIRTRYMHLKAGSICVSVGESVRQGQKIGYVGNTGYSFGDHLHFEVRTGSSKTKVGTAVNPVGYLTGTSSIISVPEQTIPGNAVIDGDNVRFRQGPSVGSTIISVLNNGATGTVLAKTGEWYKLQIGSDIGYVYSKYVNASDSEGASISSNIYGTVTGTGVCIRSSAEISSNNIIKVANKGMSIEFIEYVNEWCKIRLAEGTIAYIHSDYFNVDNKPTASDVIVNNVFTDNFEAVPLYSVPSTSRYSQDESILWKVNHDGSSNILKCVGGQVGTCYIQFTASVTNSGIIEFKYATKLATGNAFNVYVDGELVSSTSYYSNTYEYKKANIALLEGTHIVKFERNKTVDSFDEIIIDEIKVSQYLYKPKDSGGMADTIDSTITSGRVTIIADGANIRSGAGSAFPIISTMDRGAVYDLVSTSGDWYEIQLTDNSTGYIRSDLCDKTTGEQREKMLIKTGGFLFDRTLVLDNVTSVDIDFKYEMRAAEASVTIENIGGYYSPDYAPFNFPERGLNKSPFTEYINKDTIGVLSENTPVRIYLGYGNHLQRKFTGLIDTIDMDAEAKTLTFKCTDMMKKINNYFTYDELRYPPYDTQEGVAWLTSSVIHDLAMQAGMSSWRRASDDLSYPDIVIEETYYTELKPADGEYVKVNPDGTLSKQQLYSVPDNGGWRNPHAIQNKIIPKGSCISDVISDLCQNINYWQRCDYYGTYRVTSIEYGKNPVAVFRDIENLVSLTKTIDGTRIRNHLIIQGGNGSDHFFDTELWRDTKGERRTASISVPWADDYGKRKTVADKMFADIKRLSRTAQVCVEGNPYLDLFDMVTIESYDTSTKGDYIIKGIRESFSESQGYLTFLDLCWEG